MSHITLKSCLFPEDIALEVNEIFGTMIFRWMNSGNYSPEFRIHSEQVKDIRKWFTKKDNTFYKITIGESWIQFKKQANTTLYVSYGSNKNPTYGVTMLKPQTQEFYDFFCVVCGGNQ